MSTPVNRLLAGLQRFALPEASVEHWNHEVRTAFAPFVRRRSILRERRELFRTELINLAKVHGVPDGLAALGWLARLYRKIIYRDRDAALRFLIDGFPATAAAEERWISLFLTHQELSPDFQVQDRVSQLFAILDTVLEGCYKPHARIAAGFVGWDRATSFPADIARRDFGGLLRVLAQGPGRLGDGLVRESEYGIPFNQWRNIAAHRSFTVVAPGALVVAYGRAETTLHLPVAALERVLRAALGCLAVTRMASTIIYLEFMPELKAAGLPDVPIRLESRMGGLCHNLSIVGFQCLEYFAKDGVFTLHLQDRHDREPLESVVHASQVLDQLAAALEFDPTRAGECATVAITVSDSGNVEVGAASISTADVTAWSKRQLSTEERLARTTFRFADQARLQTALKSRGRGDAGEVSS